MTMATAPFTGTLAGAGFRFETDAPDLAAYAPHHLAPLAATGVSDPAVSAVLRWHDGQPPSERPSPHAQRVDRDLYVDGTQLYWYRVDDLRDLFLRVDWRGGRLAVDGDFYFRLGSDAFRDRLRRAARWSRTDRLRRRRFTTLLYYLVYYPCWWWQEHERDRHPIHAAAVAAGGGAILLAGASGVGKSTVALALAAAPGAGLLSDSFVLHSGTTLWAVPEPIPLDAWSRQWLGEHGGELRGLEGRFPLNRRGYHVPRQRLVDEARAVLLLFPRRTAEPFVRRLTSEQAHQRLSAGDLIINDLRRYWAFAAVLEQLAPRGLVARREAELARLTADVPCYEIGLTADLPLAAVVDTIMQLAHERPLRAVGSSH